MDLRWLSNNNTHKKIIQYTPRKNTFFDEFYVWTRSGETGVVMVSWSLVSIPINILVYNYYRHENVITAN